MKRSLLCIGIVATFMAACGDHENTPVQTTPEPVAEETPKVAPGEAVGPADSKLRVYKAPQTDAFNTATLELTSRSEVVDGKSAFDFAVTNYELAAQTGDAETRGCANSAKGQHIHFILNNAPYKAHYGASFEESVNAGNNLLLAFLSRSYHESVKAPDAAVITSFQVGESTEGPQIDIDADPIMFYSRPKGTYKSSAGSKVLLDFYLRNATLSKDGHQVRATIDGESWMLNEWAAYFVEGFDVGTHTVRLELLDAAGNLVPGAFNDSGDREFTITAD